MAVYSKVPIGIIIKIRRGSVIMAKLEISRESCKSCELCVSVCPKKVLEIGGEINKKGYRYVVDAHPEACIACCMCAQVCPDCVIEVFK